MKITFSFAVPVVLSGLFMFSQIVHPQAEPKQETPKASTKKDSSHKVNAPQQEGDLVFQQHCSRCHNAPEGFSPRISGTITRHMRVRASLSKHEEEELLRFLNP